MNDTSKFMDQGNGKGKRQKKAMIERRIATNTLRQFILITLAHAEKRAITQEQIADRLRKTFECLALVIAKEEHEENGFHFHVALQNTNASKNNATKLIRERTFPEFDGSQCNVKFHKGWGIMISYITKQDKEPYVWGKYSLQQIIEIGEATRRKKKIKVKVKATEEIFDRLRNSNQWLDVYKSLEVRERLIYGSYSNLRNVYQDITVLKEIERNPFERIDKYLKEKSKEGKIIEEYSPEEIEEKYILLDWIACNISCKRHIKTKQLHLYGPPSTQKTLIFDFLRKVLRIYFASSRINDFAGADDFYDLWVYDEFHQLDQDNITFGTSEANNAHYNTLLKVLDGQECRLDAKYSRVFTKTKNIPIVIIANKIASKAREYGPFQERLNRIRFNTNIENLSEERIIATLKGCILRRMKENNILNVERKITLEYNNDKIQMLGEQEVLEKIRENGEPYVTKTSKKENIKVEFCEGNIKERFLNKYQYARITIDPRDIAKDKISTLGFAIIPLKKERKEKQQRENDEETQRKEIITYKSRRKGSNFQIIRTNKEGKEDYMTWPIRIFIREKEKVWSAEICVEEKERKNTQQLPKENHGREEEQTKAISKCCLIGLGPLNEESKGYNTNMQWDAERWCDDD